MHSVSQPVPPGSLEGIHVASYVSLAAWVSSVQIQATRKAHGVETPGATLSQQGMGASGQAVSTSPSGRTIQGHSPRGLRVVPVGPSSAIGFTHSSHSPCYASWNQIPSKPLHSNTCLRIRLGGYPKEDSKGGSESEVPWWRCHS